LNGMSWLYLLTGNLNAVGELKLAVRLLVRGLAR
jgi:hypothetical protein